MTGGLTAHKQSKAYQIAQMNNEERLFDRAGKKSTSRAIEQKVSIVSLGSDKHESYDQKASLPEAPLQLSVRESSRQSQVFTPVDKLA